MIKDICQHSINAIFSTGTPHNGRKECLINFLNAAGFDLSINESYNSIVNKIKPNSIKYSYKLEKTKFNQILLYYENPDVVDKFYFKILDLYNVKHKKNENENELRTSLYKKIMNYLNTWDLFFMNNLKMSTKKRFR